MLPLRLVLDTNIIVSSMLKPQSLQRTTVIVSFSKPARLYVTQPILDEYAEVLARPELRLAKGERLQLLQLVRNHSHLVVPARRLAVTPDPDDNIFVECADAARADYLITGNRRHFQSSGADQNHLLPRLPLPRGPASAQITVGQPTPPAPHPETAAHAHP